jgi:hypothetical protein
MFLSLHCTGSSLRRFALTLFPDFLAWALASLLLDTPHAALFLDRSLLL